MKRTNLIISFCKMPTGNKGYYLSNKENTLRYSYCTMLKNELKTCEIFKEGIRINDYFILV